jgi:hypothetical protein
MKHRWPLMAAIPDDPAERHRARRAAAFPSMPMHHRQALTKDVDPRRRLLIETEQSRSPVGMAGMTSLKKAEPHQHGDVGAKHDGVGSKFRGKLERRIGDDGAALLWHALAAQEVAASANVALGATALYRALGGGWQIREDSYFVTARTADQMRARTNWGDLLPPARAPQPPAPGLPSPADVGPTVRPPEW